MSSYPIAFTLAWNVVISYISFCNINSINSQSFYTKSVRIDFSNIFFIENETPQSNKRLYCWLKGMCFDLHILKKSISLLCRAFCLAKLTEEVDCEVDLSASGIYCLRLVQSTKDNRQIFMWKWQKKNDQKNSSFNLSNGNVKYVLSIFVFLWNWDFWDTILFHPDFNLFCLESSLNFRP